MSFNPNFINTHMPPPNFPPISMQLPTHQTNPCPTPPISQQHMFNTGMHVPPPSPSSSFFNTVPPNYLPSPSPPVVIGSVLNPITTPPPTWNNVLNQPMVNRQNHNYPTALPVIPFSQDTQTAASFPVPPPTPSMQLPAPDMNNSIKNLPNNYSGLLAIAPNAGYNQQSCNNHAPVGFKSESSIPQINGSHSTESVPVWSNDKFCNKGNFKTPPPVNQMFGNSNQNRFNANKDSNAFSHNDTRNSIQKTNVPDSNIFQNPSALFKVSRNNGPLHPTVNAVMQNNFQNNVVMQNNFQNNAVMQNNFQNNAVMQNNAVAQNSFHNNAVLQNNFQNNAVTPNNFQNNATRMFPTTQSDMIFLNQAEEHDTNYENKVSINNSATNYSKFSSKHNHFRNSSEANNKFKRRFYGNKIQDNNINNNNFRSAKFDFSFGQNLSSLHNNQNLIDIKVLPNKGDFEGKFSNNKSFNSNYHYNSNSNTSAIEEYTISDSESIESIKHENSLQKNKRSFENLQSVTAESNTNNFQNKTGWMTESIQKALQKRNMLFKQARTTNDPAVWDEYNRLKTDINEEIKRAKLHSKNFKPKRSPLKMCQDKGKKLPFNCDTCDRGFPSKDELNIHIGLHIKCHYSGCNFEAHPKIVSLHQKMQHDTGYADVINKLQNDEEIKKWREERRRRFPTAENILKKKAEQAEKEARGEVIEEKHYGQFKKRNFDERNKDGFSKRQTRNNRYNRRRKHRNAFQKAPEIDLAQESDSEEESECLTKLPKFQGMKKGSEIVLDNNYIKTEDAANLKIEEANNDEVRVQASKIASNQSEVFSNQQDIKELDDDDDDEAPLEIPIQKSSLNEFSDSADENENNLSRKNDQQEILIEASEKDSPTSTPNMDEKPDKNVTSSLVTKNDRGNKRERNERWCRPPIPPRQKNSLLQMLLSDEIRHERNVIMQCIRHIVRNNFFGIETDA